MSLRRSRSTGCRPRSSGIYYSADTVAPQQIGGLHTGNLTQGINDVTVAGQATRLRLTGVPGQTTIWSKTWATDGQVRAFDSSVASKAVLGQVGPSNQGGIGAGGTANNNNRDVALYRRLANVWRTENVVEFGNQASAPANPTVGVVL